MFDLPYTILLLVALALVFDFLNGFHDSSNIVATMIASRAMSGQQALSITAVAHFVTAMPGFAHPHYAPNLVSRCAFESAIGINSCARK